MRAIIQRVPGDENSLIIEDTNKPSPENREILIRVAYASLNRLDLLQAKAPKPVLPPGASPILGVEVSGVIENLGSACQLGFKVGDRVMALLLGGGYGEFVTTDERTIFKVPNSVPLSVASAIPEAFITAWKLLFVVGKLKEGESVLLHAGSSSIGQAAIQLATRQGITVFTTCRSDEKCKVCIELGAKASFNLSISSNFAENVKAANNGKCIDVILDPVGSSYLSENLEVISMDGRWVLYGLLSGGVINEPALLGKLMGKRVSLLSTTLRSRSIDYKYDIIKALLEDNQAMPLVFTGDIKVNIDSIFDWSNVIEAHKKMSTNLNVGKILLKIADIVE